MGIMGKMRQEGKNLIANSGLDEAVVAVVEDKRLLRDTVQQIVDQPGVVGAAAPFENITYG